MASVREIVLESNFLVLNERLSEWRDQGGARRRIVAEIGYAAVAVIGVAEAVAKAAVALMGSLSSVFLLSLCYLIPNDRILENYSKKVLMGGALIGTAAWRTFLLSLVTVSLLARNLNPENMPRRDQIEDLVPMHELLNLMV